MKVTTELRLADIAAINVRNYLFNPSRYVMALVIALAYGFYLTNGIGLPDGRREWLILSAGALLFGAFCFFVFLAVGVGSALAMVRQHAGVIGPHEIEVSPEGFRDITPISESFIRWSGVSHITRRGAFLSFWVSPYLAHIVPARAFPNAEACDAFEDHARKLHAGITPDRVQMSSNETVRVVAPTSDPGLWRRPSAVS